MLTVSTKYLHRNTEISVWLNFWANCLIKLTLKSSHCSRAIHKVGIIIPIYTCENWESLILYKIFIFTKLVCGWAKVFILGVCQIQSFNQCIIKPRTEKYFKNYIWNKSVFLPIYICLPFPTCVRDWITNSWTQSEFHYEELTLLVIKQVEEMILDENIKVVL